MTTKKEEAVKKETESDVIWSQIKDLKLNLFALPDQTLEENATRMKVTDDAVHMKLKSQAVLTAMEEALKGVAIPADKEWEVTQTTRYTVLRRIIKQ